MIYFKIRAYSAANLEQIYQRIESLGYTRPLKSEDYRKLLVCYPDGSVIATDDLITWDKCKALKLTPKTLSEKSDTFFKTKQEMPEKITPLERHTYINIKVDGAKIKAFFVKFDKGNIVIRLNHRDQHICY